MESAWNPVSLLNGQCASHGMESLSGRATVLSQAQPIAFSKGRCSTLGADTGERLTQSIHLSASCLLQQQQQLPLCVQAGEAGVALAQVRSAHWPGYLRFLTACWRRFLLKCVLTPTPHKKTPFEPGCTTSDLHTTPKQSCRDDLPACLQLKPSKVNFNDKCCARPGSLCPRHGHQDVTQDCCVAGLRYRSSPQNRAFSQALVAVA